MLVAVCAFKSYKSFIFLVVWSLCDVYSGFSRTEEELILKNRFFHSAQSLNGNVTLFRKISGTAMHDR